MTELLDEAQLALEAALKHDTETYGLPDIALCGLRDFLSTVLCDKALAVARNERKAADAEALRWLARADGKYSLKRRAIELRMASKGEGEEGMTKHGESGLAGLLSNIVFLCISLFPFL